MRFGSAKVLFNLNLDFKLNQTHIFLGSSGCGKTTCLKLIRGLITPSEGEVILPPEYHDRDTSMGYVIQEAGLFPHISVFENISLQAKLRSWSANQCESRAKDLFELVQMDFNKLKDRYPYEISGGQRQRVGLVRALFLDPPVLLMDEPLSALDPIVRFELQTELKDIFEKLKKTVFIVTHDLTEAAFLGESITLMSRGEIMQHGSFKEFKNFPKNEFVTEFIHSYRSTEFIGDQ